MARGGWKIYCILCGNVHVRNRDVPCAKCRKIIDKEMPAAWRKWSRLRSRTPMCCGGMGRDGEVHHLYFHGKGWEGSHPKDQKKGEPSVGVEMGISFYAKEARTYYLRDFDSYCDSVYFGIPIEYSDPAFWQRIMDQLDLAPVNAWNDDLQTCEECGYHMDEPHDHANDDDEDEDYD